MAPGPRHPQRWAGWLGALALTTAGMAWWRDALGAAHVVLAYLLLVLGASAQGGRALGLTLSVVAFGCFNFFFVPPFHTFAVAAPVDWLVLGAFLATSAVAADLLARAQTEAGAARQRAAEVDRLSSLGAEALNAGRAEDALAAIAGVIRSTLGLARCAIYAGSGGSAIRLAAESVAASAQSPHDGVGAPDPGLPDERPRDEEAQPAGMPSSARLVEWVAESGRAAAVRADGAMRFGDPGERDHLRSGFDPSGARSLILPLRAGERTAGVLVIEHADVVQLDAPRLRFLAALSYYAALGVERVRLVAEAERAEALRQADQLKDALLASVSHDLRTPLTTIKALAHAMRTEGDERAAERAATIEEEADRLNRFVADLLDLSRLAGGALTVVPEINAVEDLLGAALQRVSGALDGRALVVSLDPAEPLLLGRFDFAHSLRILVNLIENALKYSPAGAPVEVGARRLGATIELSVSDRGPGVPPAEREQIFEAFYRPSGAPPDAGSAGLGLSIARRLAEAQGGTVAYEPRDGGGSRFVLTLPAADVAEIDQEGNSGEPP